MSEPLRARLERAVARDRDLDREIAADWCDVDRETWERPVTYPKREEIYLTAGEGVRESVGRRKRPMPLK
jgi:hypothetical protein